MVGRAGESPALSDETECRRPTSPASTFKIPHALLALQASVVTPDTVFRWDGRPASFESWQRDHSLVTAIRSSVLPYFQHTARLLGRERLARGLADLRYSADTFEREVDAFWVNGDLVISPLEQFEFIDRLVRGALPVSPTHMLTVLEAMRMPDGQVLMGAGPRPFDSGAPKGTIVRAKTGNTNIAGERVSWLVGCLDLGGTVQVFAARVRSTGSLPPSAGADLAARHLRQAFMGLRSR